MYGFQKCERRDTPSEARKHRAESRKDTEEDEDYFVEDGDRCFFLVRVMVVLDSLACATAANKKPAPLGAISFCARRGTQHPDGVVGDRCTDALWVVTWPQKEVHGRMKYEAVGMQSERRRCTLNGVCRLQNGHSHYLVRIFVFFFFSLSFENAQLDQFQK